MTIIHDHGKVPSVNLLMNLSRAGEDDIERIQSHFQQSLIDPAHNMTKLFIAQLLDPLILQIPSSYFQVDGYHESQ